MKMYERGWNVEGFYLQLHGPCFRAPCQAQGKTSYFKYLYDLKITKSSKFQTPPQQPDLRDALIFSRTTGRILHVPIPTITEITACLGKLI